MLEAHDYAAEWTPDRVAFYVDEQLVKVVKQAPQYPMQVMLDVFEFVTDRWPASAAGALPEDVRGRVVPRLPTGPRARRATTCLHDEPQRTMGSRVVIRVRSWVTGRGVIITRMLGNSASIANAAPIRAVDGGALDPLVGPQCSLAVQLRRTSGAVIGRTSELEAISQELHEASAHLAAVTLEGEPGIGKTRLLLATAELASTRGFTCVAITADEEIRGPFLVARSLFASSAIRDMASRDASGGSGQAGGRGYLRA